MEVQRRTQGRPEAPRWRWISLRQVLARHIGHFFLDDGGMDVESGLHFLQQFGTGGEAGRGHAPTAPKGFDHLAHTRVVGDDGEHLVFQDRVRNQCLGRLGFLERHGDVEAGTAALLALNPDAAAHDLGQLAADGEAKARARHTSGGGGIDLRERLEEAADLVGGNADPVSQTEKTT